MSLNMSAVFLYECTIDSAVRCGLLEESDFLMLRYAHVAVAASIAAVQKKRNSGGWKKESASAGDHMSFEKARTELGVVTDHGWIVRPVGRSGRQTVSAN